MRSRSLAALLAVVAVALTVLAAGCGGSDTISRDDYAEAVVSARDRVDFALTQITVGQGTVEVLIDRMEEAAVRIEDAADDLDDAGSAEGLEEETAKLVAAFRQLAVDLEALASDASQPGMESLLTDANALQFNSWNEANRILADLAEQGIDVKPIGSH